MKSIEDYLSDSVHSVVTALIANYPGRKFMQDGSSVILFDKHGKQLSEFRLEPVITDSGLPGVVLMPVDGRPIEQLNDFSPIEDVEGFLYGAVSMVVDVIDERDRVAAGLAAKSLKGINDLPEGYRVEYGCEEGSYTLSCPAKSASYPTVRVQEGTAWNDMADEIEISNLTVDEMAVIMQAFVGIAQERVKKGKADEVNPYKPFEAVNKSGGTITGIQASTLNTDDVAGFIGARGVDCQFICRSFLREGFPTIGVDQYVIRLPGSGISVWDESIFDATYTLTKQLYLK